MMGVPGAFGASTPRTVQLFSPNQKDLELTVQILSRPASSPKAQHEGLQPCTHRDKLSSGQRDSSSRLVIRFGLGLAFRVTLNPASGFTNWGGFAAVCSLCSEKQH